MLFLALVAILLAALNAGAQTPAGKLWGELAAKREKLPSLHQEFEYIRTLKTATGDRANKHQIILDAAQRQWREESVSGSGSHIQIFDGEDLFSMDAGGDEFVLGKRRSKKEGDPVPSPYSLSDPDWSKAVELERRPCGIPGSTHECVFMEVPLKKWTRGSPSNLTNMVKGTARLVVDTETGLLMSARTVQAISSTRGGYQSDISYLLKRMGYGTPADVSLFKLTTGMHEVKEASSWNAATIKKRLEGKPAPEMVVIDIQGKPVTLSSFKGKTVLIDFWTTWCPPCRADAPALDKLYRKYGDRDFMIVGISVNEDRATVEKFLKQNPHEFPIVLTTENEMPRPYQIGIFPTYIVIDKDGALAAAEQGNQGFGALRKLLTKVGLEVE